VPINYFILPIFLKIMLKHSPWNNSLRLFRGTLDRIIVTMEFGTISEYIAVANILEQKASFLRYEADQLLSNRAEVPTLERGFERSPYVIDSGRGRLSSIAD
jgi:hypothetical protein